MATDRRMIEEQLAYAKQAGNKARAKRLEGVLKNVRDYEAGKSDRRTKRSPYDDFFRTRKTSDRDYTHYTGGMAMGPGDPKRARQQKWTRRANTVKKHARKMRGSENVQLGVTMGGAVVSAIGGGVANHYMVKESKTDWKNQVGAKSNRNRKFVRYGYTAWGAGAGTYTGGVIGHHYGGVAPAVVGGGLGVVGGRKLGKYMGPENKKSQKQWVVYTRHAGGQVQRVKRKNPYYGKSKKR